MGKLSKPARNRIRLFYAPSENELPQHISSHMDVFGYTLTDIEHFMAVPNEEMVDFPSVTGGRYHFRRDKITHWEVIEKKD